MTHVLSGLPQARSGPLGVASSTPSSTSLRGRLAPGGQGAGTSEYRPTYHVLILDIRSIDLRSLDSTTGPAQVIKHEIEGPAFSLSLTPIHSLRHRLVRSRQYAYQDVAGFLRF